MGGAWGVWSEYSLVHMCDGISVPFLRVANCSRPQSLDGDKYSYSVANFLDSHLFEHDLVTFDEIATSDVVDCRYISPSACTSLPLYGMV